MTLKTRKPSGKASWPLVLLAGREKTGKSYTASKFSGSDLIDRTFYIEIGEGSADQYGAIPGARYEIVDHDGSWADILRAIDDAVSEPVTNGKPHAIVLDSMTELWGLLSDEQESIAKKRNKDTITLDQWSAAKKRWRKIIDAARRNKGPVIFTARYNEVTVVKNGKPTTDKEWKVDAEKNLSYEVDAIITWKQPREPYVNGIRTVMFDVPAGGFAPRDPANFNLDTFFRSLNIDGSSDRVYIARNEDPDAYHPAPDAVADDEIVKPAGDRGATSPPGISDRTRRQMFAVLAEAGVHGDTTQRDEIAAILGQPVKSRSEVTEVEALAVIADLSQRVRTAAATRQGSEYGEPPLDDPTTDPNWGSDNGR